ncbi:MAG TPA: ribbon-helix-helix domain-containing protein [Longimicrobium sp.]|nr:ribbon-helix-helix domain-containing protein [Longimicrobium sp.]
MQDLSAAPAGLEAELTPDPSTIGTKEPEVVSTHVLVSQDQVERLRELSRRTRVAQSEYLREAVDDLLTKYGKGGESK